MTNPTPVWVSGEESTAGSPLAEPRFETIEELRAHRKRVLVTAYRLFGAFGWGSLGDGHITARDPEQTNAMWLIRHGVPFHRTTTSDLVLVGPDGRVAGGEAINMTAYYIHAPIHEARPEVVAVAHTHTPYATPWAANVEYFRMICQEATAFFEDHSIFDGEEVQVSDFDTGKRIAEALAREVVARALLQIVEIALHSLDVDVVGVGDARLHVVEPGVRHQRAQGAERAGERRNDDTLHAQVIGQAGAVKRPGAAKGDEGELARVDALVDGEQAHGLGHVAVHDLEDARRGALRREPQV